jgi:sugar phosphate isomerase/epimerase
VSDLPLGSARRLAVVARALHDDFRTAAKLAREAGFAGLQLDPRLGELDLVSLSQSGQRELLSVFRANQLELASLRIDLGAKGLSAGTDIDATLDRIEKILSVAQALARPIVCIELGPPPADAALLELARRADRHGVILALRGELVSFSDLEKSAKTGDCPWFGIDFDPVAALRDEWSSDEIFSRMGQLIRHVRARDAILGSEKRTKPVVIGTGSLDWRKLLADLEGAGFRGWVTIDPVELPQPRAAAQSGAAAWRTLLLC